MVLRQKTVILRQERKRKGRKRRKREKRKRKRQKSNGKDHRQIQVLVQDDVY